MADQHSARRASAEKVADSTGVRLHPLADLRPIRVGEEPTVDSETVARAVAKHETAPMPISTALTPLEIDEDVVWNDDYDPKFRRLFDGGGVTLVLGRNSDSQSGNGIEMASLDVGKAIDTLSAFSGARFPAIDPEEIASRLRNSSHIIKTVDQNGVPFANRFAAVYLQRQQLLVVASVGSAYKTSWDLLSHPFMRTVVQFIADARPSVCALAASAPDRVTRNASSAIDLLRCIRRQESQTGVFWVCDGEDVLPTGPNAETTWIPKFASSESEGRSIGRRTKGNVVKITTEHAVDGKAHWPFSSGAPGGTFTFRSNADGKSYIALDGPSWHPDSSHVKYGLPQVFDENGLAVDAVSTLRQLFVMCLNPDVTLNDLAMFLVATNWSSEGIRRAHPTVSGANYAMPAILDGRTDLAAQVLRPIVDALPFYRSGELVKTVRKVPLHERTITGLVPEGGWGDKEAFDRLQALWDQRAARGASRDTTLASFAGLHVVVDGHDGRLARMQRTNRSAVRYRIVIDDQDRSARSQKIRGRGARSSTVLPTLDHEWLLQAALQACLRADGAPLLPLVADSSVATQVAVLENELRLTERRVEDLQAKQASAIDMLDELSTRVGGSGSRVLLDGFIDRQQTRAEEIERGWVRVRELEARIQTLSAPSYAGISPGALEAVAGDIADGQGHLVVPLLRQNLHNLRLDTAEVGTRASGGTHFELSGQLVLATEEGLRSLPLRARFVRGSGIDTTARVAAVVTKLRAGMADPAVRGKDNIHLEMAVRPALGPLAWVVPVMSCRDRDLLRLIMAIGFPNPVEGEDPSSITTPDDLRGDAALVERFGGPEALEVLIERVGYMLATPRKPPRWTENQPRLTKPAALIAAGLDPAAAHCEAPGPSPWVLSWPFPFPPDEALVKRRKDLLRTPDDGPLQRRERRGLQLSPCPHCGSCLLAVVSIREVTGSLCLAPHCRRDTAGVRFDQDFDAWIIGANHYIAAGVPLRSATERQTTPLPRARRYRYLEDLSPEDRILIGKEFNDWSRTQSSITRDHALARGVLAELAREDGLRPRDFGRRRAPDDGDGHVRSSPVQ